MPDRRLRLFHPTSECVTGSDDSYHGQKGRRLPERLLSPGGGQIEASREQMRQRHSRLHPKHLGIEWAKTHGASKKFNGSVRVTV